MAGFTALLVQSQSQSPGDAPNTWSCFGMRMFRVSGTQSIVSLPSSAHVG